MKSRDKEPELSSHAGRNGIASCGEIQTTSHLSGPPCPWPQTDVSSPEGAWSMGMGMAMVASVYVT